MNAEPPSPGPVPILRWRVAFGLTGLLCLGIAAWMIQWRLGRGAAWSPLFVATLVATFVIGATSFVMASLPTNRLTDWASATQHLLLRLRTVRPMAAAPTWLWCGVALGATLFVAGVFRAPFDPENDQKAFLALARQIHSHGGVTALVGDLYLGGTNHAGWYVEANRHPLYPALHSLAAPEETPLVRWGRVLSCAGVLGVIVVLARWLARNEGTSVAVLFSALCLVNRSLFEAAQTVACEGLLCLVVAALWLGIPKGPAELATPWRWFLAGMLCGGVWLTKGTGLLFLGGTLVWLVGETAWGRWAGAWRRSGLAAVLFCLGWGLTASPLLVRNIRLFGSPQHNENSWLLFVDEFEDPHVLAEQRSLGEQAREYLRTHTSRELVSRGLSGMIWEGLILARSAGPWPLSDGRLIPGLGLLLLAGVGLVSRADAGGRLPLVWLITQYPLFAWYVPVAAGDRFLTPLVGLILLFAAIGLLRLWWLVRAESPESSPPTTPAR